MSTRPKRPLVLDASALVALLADGGPAGRWVATTLDGAPLAAPHLAPFEVANILRRQALAGRLQESEAALAHADLLSIPLSLWPYAALAERVWQLRENFTAYDGAYIALAELLDTAVLTLDARTARAPGARCPVLSFQADSR